MICFSFFSLMNRFFLECVLQYTKEKKRSLLVLQIWCGKVVACINSTSTYNRRVLFVCRMSLRELRVFSFLFAKIYFIFFFAYSNKGARAMPQAHTDEKFILQWNENLSFFRWIASSTVVPPLLILSFYLVIVQCTGALLHQVLLRWVFWFHFFFHFFGCDSSLFSLLLSSSTLNKSAPPVIYFHFFNISNNSYDLLIRSPIYASTQEIISLAFFSYEFYCSLCHQ
jgi:hypothetical protein